MNVNVTYFIDWGYNWIVGLFLMFMCLHENYDKISIVCTREVLIKRKGSCGRNGHTSLFLTLRCPCHQNPLWEILELSVAQTAGRKASADSTFVIALDTESIFTVILPLWGYPTKNDTYSLLAYGGKSFCCCPLFLFSYIFSMTLKELKFAQYCIYILQCGLLWLCGRR